MTFFDFSTTIITKCNKNVMYDIDGEEKLSKNSDRPTVDADMKTEAFSFMRLAHENVKFSDLAEKMRPVCVEGLEEVTGVLGRLENVSGENEPHTVERFEKTGKPTEGALLWADVALFIEGKAEAFESSVAKNSPQVLKLNRYEILPGILVACRFLYPGQCAQFLLPPHTMYGEQGCYPIIPKSATILMVIKSIRWIDAGAPYRYETLDDLLKKDFITVQNIIENSNEAAGYYFTKKKYRIALKFYKKISNILDNLDTNMFQKDINTCKIRNFVNIAICYNCLQNPYYALSNLNKASNLGNCNENCKYLYTRGKTLFSIGEYETAIDFFTLALTIEPNNTEIGDELSKLEIFISKYKKESTNIVKNMFKSYNSESASDEVQDDELVKNVTDLCELLKTTTIACYPFPPSLLSEEETKLQEIVERIDGLKVISHRFINGNIQKNIVIIKNT